jgi:hypothetical protein
MRRFAYLGALLTIAVDATYLALRSQQSGLAHFSPRTDFVAGLTAAVAAAAVFSTFRRFAPLSPLLLAFSAAAALALGLLAILSIGLPLLLAGALFIPALLSTPPVSVDARVLQITLGATAGAALPFVALLSLPL